ncbi:hypothetical protein ZWY2020_020166 [Hordeum vulgare]|nr:hypothetical protein ZWY2020_020166 [Hordeum vulgare]
MASPRSGPRNQEGDDQSHTPKRTNYGCHGRAPRDRHPAGRLPGVIRIGIGGGHHQADPAQPVPVPCVAAGHPEHGLPAICDNAVRLEGNGHGLVSFTFPPTFWAGRLVARTGCTSPSRCETGNARPVGVVQLAVHSAEGGGHRQQDLVVYSVSLVDGFNVPAVVSPQSIGGDGPCPALGCAADLNAGCPPAQRVVAPAAAWSRARPSGYFKQRCR